jgi:hypothetical protein
MKFSSSLLALSVFQTNLAVVTGFAFQGPKASSANVALGVSRVNGFSTNNEVQQVRRLQHCTHEQYMFPPLGLFT